MKYEFFDHTADAKFRAYGKNVEEQFANAALAMTAIMINPEEVKGVITKTIQAKGNDLKQLLYNWIDELIFLLDTKQFLLHEVKKLTITKTALKAVVTGDTFKETYQVKSAVKAATYAEMEITKKYVQIVVDI